MSAATIRASVLLLVAACGAGCAGRRPHDQPRLTREEAAARAAVRFAAATLLKPADTALDRATFALAPLVLSEVSYRDTGGRFGALDCGRSGRWCVDPAAPTIYYHSHTVLLDGVDRRQLSFVWWFPPPASAVRSAPSWRLLRMTLDSAGFPVVWEVFSAEAANVLVFVSESLERSAEAQFGPPLPGCRYAVERRTVDAPHVVVVRVLDDGPVPMGPMVYLDAPHRAVTAVLCRCMPAQVENVTETGYYTLAPCELPARTDVTVGAETLFLPVPPAKLPAGVGEFADENWLARALRLPAGF